MRNQSVRQLGKILEALVGAFEGGQEGELLVRSAVLDYLGIFGEEIGHEAVGIELLAAQGHAEGMGTLAKQGAP